MSSYPKTLIVVSIIVKEAGEFFKPLAMIQPRYYA